MSQRKCNDCDKEAYVIIKMDGFAKIVVCNDCNEKFYKNPIKRKRRYR